MIDSIRRQQIDEVLKYDKNMNLQVLSLEKRGVAKMKEATDLSLTQKQDVIQDANTKVNNLMIRLEKKRAEVSALQHYTVAHAEQHTSSVDELAKVYEVIDFYNETITIYLTKRRIICLNAVV